jgi:hypothetical protein
MRAASEHDPPRVPVRSEEKEWEEVRRGMKGCVVTDRVPVGRTPAEQGPRQNADAILSGGKARAAERPFASMAGMRG